MNFSKDFMCLNFLFCYLICYLFYRETKLNINIVLLCEDTTAMRVLSLDFFQPPNLRIPYVNNHLLIKDTYKHNKNNFTSK